MRFFRVVGGSAYGGDDAELRAYVEKQIDRAPFDFAGAARHMAAYVTAEPRNDILKLVRAPTLVLHGADDPLIQVACGKDTADSVPGAKLVIVPGMGHDFSEALVREVYLKHVADFLAEVEAQSRATAS